MTYYESKNGTNFKILVTNLNYSGTDFYVEKH